MKFKKGMFIDEKTLTKAEAIEFRDFLLSEIQRHVDHMKQYQIIARDDNSTAFMRIVALTVVQRNLEDIEHTERTLKILEGIINE